MRDTVVLLDDLEIPTGDACSDCEAEMTLVVSAGEVAIRCGCGLLAALE